MANESRGGSPSPKTNDQGCNNSRPDPRALGRLIRSAFRSVHFHVSPIPETKKFPSESGLEPLDDPKQPLDPAEPLELLERFGYAGFLKSHDHGIYHVALSCRPF